jgi:DNA repair photolyase
MKPRIAKSGAGLVLTLGLLLLPAAPAHADDKLLQELKERLDRLEKQNEDLRKQLQETGRVAPYKAEKEEKAEKEKVHQVIDSYLRDRDAKKKQDGEKKAKQKEEEGFEVGKQLDAKARWQNSQL